MNTTTIIRRSKAYSVACVVAISGFALYAGSASAHECNLADGNRDTGWSIRFDDAHVSNCVFTGNTGTGRNKGTLNLTLKITDRTPIPIEFVQRNRATADSFGLRITWNLTLNNQFQTLKGLRGRALDSNAVLEDDINQFVADEHPGFAHFHQDPSFNPGPFSGAPDCDCESDRDFKVVDSAFAGGSTGIVAGIGVHQIEEQGFQRNFTVRIEPIRENTGQRPHH